MDWNSDGKTDLLSGDTSGSVWLFLNIGGREKAELAKGVRVEADGKSIAAKSHKEAETYSKIHMADWDGDGLKDLLIGQINTIVFYKNVGTPSAPRFLAPTPIQIPEGKFYFLSSPYVADWDGDGKKDLLVGTESKGILFYRNIGTVKEPRLDRGKPLALKVPGGESIRWRIDLADWNNDGKIDILLGNTYTVTRTVRSWQPSGNIWLFLGK